VTITATSGGPATTVCTATLDSLGTGDCALSPAELDAGTYLVQATYAGSTGLLSSSASTPLTIEAQATTLTPAPLTLAPAGDGTVAATLTSQLTGEGVGGQPVAFTLGSDSCTGTTDDTGLASCTVAPTSLVVLDSVPVSFAGSVDYSSSMATLSLTPYANELSDDAAQFNLNTELATAKAYYAAQGGYPDAIPDLAQSLMNANPTISVVHGYPLPPYYAKVSIATYETNEGNTPAQGPNDGTTVVMAAYSSSTGTCWWAEDTEGPGSFSNFQKFPAGTEFSANYGPPSFTSADRCDATDQISWPFYDYWTGGYPPSS
jgi:hypothetical protein